jgi:hypothetical protein
MSLGLGGGRGIEEINCENLEGVSLVDMTSQWVW